MAANSTQPSKDSLTEEERLENDLDYLNELHLQASLGHARSYVVVTLL